MSRAQQDGAGTRRPRVRGGRGSVVPDAEPRSYYDLPIVKAPVWTWEVPAYFFVGGTAGASSVLAAVAEATGRTTLARTARLVAAGAVATSPPLLIRDLGRPERFHHMLRVLKPTSPMSVGSWILALYAPAAIGAAGLEALGWFPRLRRVAGAAAAGLGPALSTYTAVLLTNTAVPVWHQAERTLPAVFAASSTMSSGAAAVLVDPTDPAARAVAVAGGLAELVTTERMHRALDDDVAGPYREGDSARWAGIATAATAAGSALVALAPSGRGGRLARRVGALGMLAGAAATRWSVFRAGFASAADPAATVGPQRRRIAARASSTEG
ncbi:NrfD/PsrC family molybdoenzyme membrane anchor subunit [Euzebya rosea]|uniref:NrfD/PsrC family molybdoenzyme membrane anchor subunit n=1 Tax=Euzebya rosea TaxID=2052804 RepID=UPI000D3EA1D9|nr:NrfD/PsrC family molybdoenzyme membrane anchor subunit [Euzebya rosea]